jgi:opacity protein-like surface antigen
MKKMKSILVTGAILAMLCTSAFADDPSDSDWQFRLAPLYLWTVNISGDQTIGPITVPIELDFDDIFDSLESVFTANFEAIHNNQWGFLVDLSYIDIKDSQGPVTVNFQNTLAEVDGLYRVASGEHNIDILLGLRYTDQETKVKPTPLSVSQDWVDPIIGARWWWNFADRWGLIVRGDVGGFGVGSDFTWQALALVDWQPFKNVSFVGGYRALYQDFEDDSSSKAFEYKATLHGPLLGVNIKW